MDLSALKSFTPSEATKRAQIKETAQNFEASFLSVMMMSMWQGVGQGEFSGGKGEEMFRSVMTDAMGKAVAKAGGVGLSQQVEIEMLKMQGLSV